MRASPGNSELKAGPSILLFVFILSLATLHSGCAGVAGSSNPGGPTVSITSPASGATVSASITVSANASADTVGVQFKLDGANLGSEKTSAPFSVSWDTTTAANGAHSLTAVARNAAGRTGTSAAVSITAQNSSGGGPTVSITSPTSGATASASITVSANASANTVGVQFKLDGANLGSETTSAPYSVSWDTTTAANGQHTLTALARNAAGQTATSAAVSVTVQNSSGGNPPVISGVGAGPGSTSASIFWITDKPSDSQVDYGTSVSYGQSSALDSSQVILHGIAIDGLSASTLYHYRVKSKDSVGLATSVDSTFTTLPAGAQGSLATLAAAMAPGTWAELVTNGFNPGGHSIFSPPPCSDASDSDSILGYFDRAAWDPTTKKVVFLSGAHTQCAVKLVVYNDATNTWSYGLNYPGECIAPPVCPAAEHGYEHSSIGPVPGHMYYRAFNSNIIRNYDITTNTWVGNLPAIPMPGWEVAGALVWFPDRGELVFADAGWGVWAYKAGAWTQIAQTPTVPGSGPTLNFDKQYHNIAQYNPVQRTVIMASVATMYRYDANGAFTGLAAAPEDMEVSASTKTIDPVTGNMLFIGGTSSSITFRKYDPARDTWTSLSTANVPAVFSLETAPASSLVAVPISTYGVTMWFKYASGGRSKVYIYKDN